jgi:hypothetical protein
LKFLFFLISIAVLPFCLALIIGLPVLFSKYRSVSVEMLVAGAGFMVLGGVFFLFGPPVKSYLLEHELSHVLFAWLSGVRVKHFSMSRSGGYVRTERVNILIALAPYTLPLYTILLIAVYKFLTLFFSLSSFRFVFYFLFGLTLAFHLLATVHYIQIYQPDLARYGYFASLVFIFLCSLLALVLVLAIMFEKVQIIHYFSSSLVRGVQFYRGLFQVLEKLLTACCPVLAAFFSHFFT